MSIEYRIQVNTQFIDKDTGDVVRAGSLFKADELQKKNLSEEEE